MFPACTTVKIDRVDRRADGALEVLERVWSGEPVDYEGKHFRLHNVRLSMPPVQRPRPPIWLAANGDVGVKRAARLADTWLINPHTALPTLERQLALFHATRREAGRAPAAEVPLIRECYVAESAATAFEEVRPYLEPKYQAYRQWEQEKALPEGETWSSAFAELARDRFIIGDPVRVREEIARYRERLGVTSMMFRLQWPGLDQARVLRSIRLFGEQVLPHFS